MSSLYVVLKFRGRRQKGVGGARGHRTVRESIKYNEILPFVKSQWHKHEHVVMTVTPGTDLAILGLEYLRIFFMVL